MPEIKYFPKLRVAFLTMVGPFDQAIPGGLEKLFAWVRSNQVQTMGAPYPCSQMILGRCLPKN